MEIWSETIFRNVRNDIRVATTDDEVTKIGKLRFSLYVDRDHKLYEHADHRHRTLIEPLDPKSLNFYAAGQSGVRAAVRLSRASDSLSDPLLAPMMAGIAARNLKQTLICSRFVVEPTFAARKAIVPLFQEVYRAGLTAGATKCVLSIGASLIGMVERFGFKESGIRFVDTVAGQLHTCVLDLYDYEFLTAIASPLIDVANEQFAPPISPSLKAALQGLTAPAG